VTGRAIVATLTGSERLEELDGRHVAQSQAIAEGVTPTPSATSGDDSS
jgi:hypothetical protein